MSEEDQLKHEVEFAQMGQQVLNNAAYKQAIMLRKAQIFELFCSSKQDQADIREECWRTMVNITALEQYFQTLLTTGKMAETSLKQKE